MIRWENSRPVLDESWPVRYRFESLGALQRHLRLGTGFFLPDGALPCGPGARVIVEVAVPETWDRPLLHGRVREHAREGIWLDLPSARPATRWEPDPDAPRRQHPRVACELFVEVQPRDEAPWICRALDLSEGGLRIATALDTGFRGDELFVTLFTPDGSLAPADLRGRLVWSGSHETGIAILERSRDYPALLGAAAGRWGEVEEIEHAEDCACAQRVVATGQRQP